MRLRLFRVRFSLKMLLGLAAIAAVYMAMGPWTRQGKADVIELNVARNGRMMQSTELFIPFVFRCEDVRVDQQEPFLLPKALRALNYEYPVKYRHLVDSHRVHETSYYVWLFGYVATIPITFDGVSETFDQETRRWIVD